MTDKTKTMTADLLSGSVPKTLLRFAVPFMFSTLLQTLYSTTDTIVVGQFLGKDGVSAVSNGSQLMQMVYMVCIGFSNAGQILIAQCVGAGNTEKLRKVIGTLFYLEVGVSAVIGMICLFGARQFAALMNTPAEAFDQACLYIMICSGGILFTGLYNMYSAILRGMGDSRHPLLFVVIATSLNVVLDILFIAAFHWNVAGAALATIIGQAVSVAFSIWFLTRHEGQFHVEFNILKLKPDTRTAAQIASLGVPMAFQAAAVQISFIFVASMINRLGVAVSAVFGITQKLKQFPGFISQGLGLAISSMIGQNFGAGNIKRVSSIVKTGILFTTIIEGAFAAMYLLMPQFWFRLFMQDQDVLIYASMIAGLLALEAPAKCFMPSCNSLISALGFVKLSMTVALLDAFAGRVFLCWFCGVVLNLGVFGYFLGYFLGTYITSILVSIYYFSGRWKKRALVI